MTMSPNMRSLLNRRDQIRRAARTGQVVQVTDRAQVSPQATSTSTVSAQSRVDDLKKKVARAQQFKLPAGTIGSLQRQLVCAQADLARALGLSAATIASLDSQCLGRTIGTAVSNSGGYVLSSLPPNAAVIGYINNNNRVRVLQTVRAADGELWTAFFLSPSDNPGLSISMPTHTIGYVRSAWLDSPTVATGQIAQPTGAAAALANKVHDLKAKVEQARAFGLPAGTIASLQRQYVCAQADQARAFGLPAGTIASLDAQCHPPPLGPVRPAGIPGILIPGHAASIAQVGDVVRIDRPDRIVLVGGGVTHDNVVTNILTGGGGLFRYTDKVVPVTGLYVQVTGGGDVTNRYAADENDNLWGVDPVIRPTDASWICGNVIGFYAANGGPYATFPWGQNVSDVNLGYRGFCWPRSQVTEVWRGGKRIG